ncbi:MAG: glycine oxidase ThiO [Mycobacteriales bacterium]
MTEVAIVGAGLIGLAIAWRTAQRGVSVTLIDDQPERAASRTAAGMLAPISELHYGEQKLLQLGMRAAQRYPEFVAQLREASGIDVGYRRCGTINVGLDNDDHRALGELFDYASTQGVQLQRLRGRECREAEPLLAPSVRGGAAVESDHHVDPRKLLAALRVAAESAGVTIVSSRVQELHCDADQVHGVRLDGGETVDAPKVVIAAGCWSASIAGVPLAARPPVRPVKGQLLRLKAPAGTPFLRHTVRGLVHGAPVYLVPRSDGELILGATCEEQGFDLRVTLEAIYTLVRDARLLIPGITELELVEISTGLRPGSPDNAPIVGPHGPRGLYWATGHYRNGALLADITAAGVANLLTTGVLPSELAPFSAHRFATFSLKTSQRWPS